MYIEQLGAVNLTEMYKITTFERMLQNLVYEYETFTSKRLVCIISLFSLSLKTLLTSEIGRVLTESWCVD